VLSSARFQAPRCKWLPGCGAIGYAARVNAIMTLHDTHKKLENDCFNGPGPRPVASLGLPRKPAPLLTVVLNPLHELKHFSLILGLKNTGIV
jgi:hypothetical protein